MDSVSFEMLNLAPMLINCSECGKQFSDNASACPNCGNPVPKKNSNVDGPGNSNRASRVKLSGFIASAVGILIFLSAGLIVGSEKSCTNLGGYIGGRWFSEMNRSCSTYMSDSQEISYKGLRSLGLLVIGGGLFYSLEGSLIDTAKRIKFNRSLEVMKKKLDMISGIDFETYNRWNKRENERNRWNKRENERISNRMGKIFVFVFLFIAIISLI